MGAALAGDRDLGSSCRVLGPPIPEKEPVTGTHALVSTGSVSEGAVEALLGYRTLRVISLQLQWGAVNVCKTGVGGYAAG